MCYGTREEWIPRNENEEEEAAMQFEIKHATKRVSK